MKNKRRHRIIRLFLPLLFLFYWGSITLFTHFHVINGVVVVHSHINIPGHEHTPGEFVTILNLSSLISSELDTTPIVPSTFWVLLVTFIPFFILTIQNGKYNGNASRAPPYSLS